MIEGLVLPISLWLTDKVAGSGYDYLVENINKDDLDSKFLESVNIVAENMENKYPEILGGSIKYFFTEKNVLNELYKLLIYNSKIKVKIIHEKFDTDTLDVNFIKDFIKSLKKELLKNPEFNKILSNKEFYQAIIEVKTNITNINESSKKSSRELTKIRETLENKNSFDLNDFIINYKKTSITSLTEINFIGLGLSANINRSKKILTDIYIEPFLKNEYKKYKLKDLFSITNKNIVILGNPGSGKSTLTKYIMLNLLKKTDLYKKIESNTIPFRIELRNYIKYKKEKRGNILQYLSDILLQDNLLSISSEIIEKNILKKLNTIILFDGLDEIFDTSDKISVKNDIENISKLYPKLYTLITSRKIGYDNAKLNDDNFFLLELEDLNREQIQLYLKKWYYCEETNKNTINAEIELFNDLVLKQSLDFELLKNPLFLSLIVIIFRNTHEIPNNKLEIYKSCTKTLVEKWDKNKKLIIDENVISKRDSIFANIAFWQYKELSNKNNITYHLVLKEVKNIIKKLNISKEEYEIENFAYSFLEYAEKRSLYFDNNFTHKTFLEYYTAYWIFQNYEKKGKFEKRNEIINEYANNSFWFIVFELLFSLIDNEQPDNEILDNLFIEQMDNKSSYALLIYCLPILSNLSSSIIENLINQVIFELVNSKDNTNHSEYTYYDRNEKKYDLFNVFLKLCSYNRFNSIINTSFLINYETMKNDDNLIFRLIQLYSELFHYFYNIDYKNNYPFWIDKKSFKRIRNKNYILYSKYAYRTRKIKYFIKAIDLFGIEQLFLDSRCLYLTNQGLSSMIDVYKNEHFENPDKYEKNFLHLINNNDKFFNMFTNHLHNDTINLNSHSGKSINKDSIKKIISLLNEMKNKKLELMLLYMLVENILNHSLEEILSDEIISNIENPLYFKIVKIVFELITSHTTFETTEEELSILSNIKQLLQDCKNSI